MPGTYRKTELIKNLCIKYSLDMMMIDTSDEDEEEDLVENFNLNMISLLKNRRISHLHVPKSTTWRLTVLHGFDESRVRSMIRVNSLEFAHILDLIKNDEVFKNQNSVPQLPIQQQLEIALYRFGCSGEGASIRKCSTLFSVGDGGTVQKITNRVIAAILNLQSTFLVWPSEEERLHIEEKTSDELPGCIGYIDGTEIKLAEAPAQKHELFYSRKRQYSVKMQLICDYKLRIRQVTIGSPGSFHDAKIFAKSPIARTPQRFFSNSQWIAGDSAYPLGPNLLTPFRQNNREFTRNERENFNKYFSKYRVRVENCIGKLKEVFGSLKELRFRYIKSINNAECNNWIAACCILHNILINYNNLDTDGNNFEHYTPFELPAEENLRRFMMNFVNNKTNSI